MGVVLCIDTSPDTEAALRTAGHTVHSGSVGLINGQPDIQYPPHEADLILCDLLAPACYDSNDWGPGRNDNYRVKVVPNPPEQYIRRDDKLHPRYKIIHTGQMHKPGRHCFGPDDVFAAAEKAGVPAVMFLNPSWLRHIDYNAPNVFGVSWAFKATNASKLKYETEFVDIVGTELVPSIATPLKFAISAGAFRSKSSMGKQTLCATKPLVTNAIGEVFAQQVMLEKGSMWILPSFTNNSHVALRMLENLPQISSQGIKEVLARPLTLPTAAPTTRDVFISHASEDKSSIARPLAEQLRSRGLTVWFDEYELVLGDRLRAKIDEGLRNSRFGVTILSHSFFGKSWPQAELDGLLSLERDSKRILPVWHSLTVDEVRSYSPILSGRLGISTDKGITAVVAAIERAVLGR